jgi:hypothetical protein
MKHPATALGTAVILAGFALGAAGCATTGYVVSGAWVPGYGDAYDTGAVGVDYSYYDFGGADHSRPPQDRDHGPDRGGRDDHGKTPPRGGGPSGGGDRGAPPSHPGGSSGGGERGGSGGPPSIPHESPPDRGGGGGGGGGGDRGGGGGGGEEHKR